MAFSQLGSIWGANQDADNLGWKLARIMQGKMPARLLDSYDAERREGARQNIEFTRHISRYLSPENPAEKQFRDATIALARKYAFARTLVNTGRMSSANTYPQSPLHLTNDVVTHVQNVALTVQGKTLDLVALQAMHTHQTLVLAFSSCAR